MSTPKKIFDVFIIGTGPAGLTAAIYCGRACLSVGIIEKLYLGGKLTKTLSIENYPGFLENSGPVLADRMIQQTNENGAEHFDGDVTSIQKHHNNWTVRTADKREFQAKAILIATGTKEKTIGIKNEIEYYGKGVSYCAVCEGNLYKNQEVIVVGGGNSAAEEAIYLSKLASKVTIVHRRNEFRADAILVKQIKEIKNIVLETPNTPVSVEVADGVVCGLKIKHTETKEEKIIEGKCVFFYIGLIPENYFLKNLNLEYDNIGFIKVDEHMQTNIPGIFAAGDIITKHLRQVVTALNDGAIAAISIKNYLNNEHK